MDVSILEIMRIVYKGGKQFKDGNKTNIYGKGYHMLITEHTNYVSVKLKGHNIKYDYRFMDMGDCKGHIAW